MRKAITIKSKKKIVIIVILLLILAIAGGFLLYQVMQFRYQKRYRRHLVKAYQSEDYEKALQYVKDVERTKNIFGYSLEEDVAYYEADCYVKLENYEKAISLYDAMLAQNSTQAKLYILKANCYMKQDQIQEALKVYKLGYDTTKDTAFIPNLAYCYMERESYDSARKIIEAGLQSGDEEIQKDLLFDEIVLYEKEMDYNTAYEKAKAFVELYPDDEDGQREYTFLETRQTEGD